MKRATTRKPEPTAPSADPAGLFAMKLAADIQAINKEAGMFRIAYSKLTYAIDALKTREPYLSLEKDLVAEIERRQEMAGSR